MEWTGEKILSLISLYKERPMLWDPTHTSYKSYMKKYEAWEDLSRQLDGLPVEELKKKMGSLLATFRKIRRQQLTRCDDDITWFAYKSFSFMNRIYTPKLFVPQENCLDLGDDFSLKEDTDSKLSLEELVARHQGANDSIEPGPGLETNTNGMMIKTEEEDTGGSRKRPAGQSENDELEPDEEKDKGNKKRRSSWREPDQNGGHHRQGLWLRPADDCVSFGRYLADKLRTYSRTTRSAVQHAVSEIIFSADQGRFETYCEDYPAVGNRAWTKPQVHDPFSANVNQVDPELTETFP